VSAPNDGMMPGGADAEKVTLLFDFSTWKQRRESAIKRLRMFLRNDEALIEAYLSMYGLKLSPDHVAAIAGLSVGERKDPAFEIVIGCPICDHKPITSYMTRGEGQKLTQNEFLVPIAAEGVKGYAPLSPLVYSIHVCPACGFASAERDEWPTVKPQPKEAKKPLRMSSTLRDVMQATASDRLAVADGADLVKAFERPRDLEALALGCKLGIASEAPRVEAEASKAAYRTGGHYLRLATVAWAYGDEDHERDYLTKALECFEKEYGVEGVDEILGPLCYLIIALGIRFDDEQKARQYRDVLASVERSATGQTVKWIQRGKDMYQDWREDRKLAAGAEGGEAAETKA